MMILTYYILNIFHTSHPLILSPFHPLTFSPVLHITDPHIPGVRWSDLTAYPPLISAIQTLSHTLAANDHHRGDYNHDDIVEEDRRWRRYSQSLETVLQGMGAVNV